MDNQLQEFLRPAFSVLPAPVRANAMLGGGALRAFYDGTAVKDYDLFFASCEEFARACAYLRRSAHFEETTAENETQFPSFSFDSEDGRTFVFNLIGFRHLPNLSELAMSFDFTCVAHAAAWPEHIGLTVVSVGTAIGDARDRVLRFQRRQTFGRASRRAKRYFDAYGYRPCNTFYVDLESCRFVTPTEGDPDY